MCGVAVVPGALPLHVIVVTMFGTPLASNGEPVRRLRRDHRYITASSVEGACCTECQAHRRPGCHDAQAQSEDRTQREARMTSQKARSDAEVLQECHERTASNGTSSKAETAAPGHHESLLRGKLCGFTAWASALSVRSWDSRFPGSATPSWTILGDGIARNKRKPAAPFDAMPAAR